MKSNVIGMFLAVGAVCVCTSALDAQSNDLSAKIPFGFQVAGKAFPAGRYLVAEHGYVGVPSLQNAATGEAVFVTGADHSLTKTGPAKLVFHCYVGNTCFLAQIQPPYGSGSNVSMSKAEKEIVNGDRAREMATVSIDVRRAD